MDSFFPGHKMNLRYVSICNMKYYKKSILRSHLSHSWETREKNNRSRSFSSNTLMSCCLLYPRSTGGEVYCFTSVLPSVPRNFRCIFLSNYWWQKSDIWSQASYRYAILWEAFLNPSDSYFLFADLVGFYAHWTLYTCRDIINEH